VIIRQSARRHILILVSAARPAVQEQLVKRGADAPGLT
jgi:hypothetical protein